MSRRLAPTPLSPATVERARRHRSVIAAPPAGSTRAIRHGAFADPRNLPAYPEVLESVQRLVAEQAPWVQATDQYTVETFASCLTGYHHTEAALSQLPPRALAKKHKAVRANTSRLRVLHQMANDLGLTPAGRVKLGLRAAQTAAIRVQPIKTESRALEVASILAEARAIPNVIDVPDPPAEPIEARGELIPLREVGDNGAA